MTPDTLFRLGWPASWLDLVCPSCGLRQDAWLQKPQHDHVHLGEVHRVVSCVACREVFRAPRSLIEAGLAAGEADQSERAGGPAESGAA